MNNVRKIGVEEFFERWRMVLLLARKTGRYQWYQ